MKMSKVIIYSVAIILGLGINAYFIGRGMERIRKEDRFISVKGFSEREVKSNFAVWTIRTRITSNDLIAGSKEVELSKSKIYGFLKNNSIAEKDIVQKDLRVLDKLAREWGNSETGSYRYIIENTIQVRTEDVDKIKKVSSMTDELLKAGVVISQDYGSPVQYLYTQLNNIKPEMLSEATQNAKKAAIEFTKESNVKLGNLKRASQGLFSIIDRDDFFSSGSGETGGYPSGVNDVYKKVKVVVNIEYSIR